LKAHTTKSLKDFKDILFWYIIYLLLIRKFKIKIAKHVEITDLGELHWILGIEVHRICECRLPLLSQCSYIESILQQYRFEDAKPVSLPVTYCDTYCPPYTFPATSNVICSTSDATNALPLASYTQTAIPSTWKLS
jgi:hypothetical protein